MKEIRCCLTLTKLWASTLSTLFERPSMRDGHVSKEKCREGWKRYRHTLPTDLSANDWETVIPALSQKVETSKISAHLKIWTESSFVSYCLASCPIAKHIAQGRWGKV